MTPGSPQASLGKEDENGNDSEESNEEDELKMSLTLGYTIRSKNQKYSLSMDITDNLMNESELKNQGNP